MNLEILSLEEALKYEPREKSCAIRIFSSHKDNIVYWITELKKNDNWVDIKKYEFDDIWPSGYDAFDYSNFGKAEEIYLKENFLGGVYGRQILFDCGLARRILDDFEKVSDQVDNVMIHCMKGENRSAAVGIAMNEIYDWGYPDLKKEFKFYRKWVYDVMIETARKR